MLLKCGLWRPALGVDTHGLPLEIRKTVPEEGAQGFGPENMKILIILDPLLIAADYAKVHGKSNL